MPVSSVTEHWIRPDALTINLNHFGDPDYLQVSLLAGAVVMAFKQDVIGYNAAHNYRTWPLEAANTYLETTSPYHVYIRLTRSEVNASALVVYDTKLRDIEGREITYDTEGREVLGDPNADYFFIYLGKISSSIDRQGNNVQRIWETGILYGVLTTTEQNNYSGFLLDKMFRPHYDDLSDPNRITSIEALSGLWTQYFLSAKGISPSIGGGDSGLIKQVYGYSDINKSFNNSNLNDTFNAYTISRLSARILALEQNSSGSGGGGTADTIEWEKILYKPTWLVDEKPKVSYFDNDAKYITNDSLADYATQKWVENKNYITSSALNGYATEVWVNGKGYAIATDVANTYVTKTTFNTLKTDFDNLSALLNDDVQGKINTWHEVVDFLDEYSGSQDLATILSTMNADIASRLEKTKFAEYFSNEMAKWFVKDDANKGIKPVNSYGLYSDTYVSAKGVSTGTGGSGGGSSYDRLDSWADYTSAKAGYVLSALLGYDLHTRVNSLANAGYITASALSGYAKLSDIPTVPTSLKNPYALSFGNKLYDGSAANTITASDLGALTSHQDISHLLSKTEAASTYQTIISSDNKIAYNNISGTPASLPASDVYSWAKAANKPSYAFSEITNRPTTLGGYGIVDAYTATTIDSKLSGYLPLSGGMITSNSIEVLSLNTKSASLYPAIGFYNNGTRIGVFRLTGNNTAAIYDGDFNTAVSVITSGNIGSQSVSYASSAGSADELDGYNLITEVTDWNSAPNTILKSSESNTANAPYGGYCYGAVLRFHRSQSTFYTDLVTNLYSDLLFYRRHSDRGYGDWKQIAFTDSNVASATKLQTARTIWGQSFDGTGDVSGHMTLTTGFDVGGVNMFIVSDKVYVGSKWYNSVWKGASHSFEVGDSTQMVINSSSNVLIGTTTDIGFKFVVNGYSKLASIFLEYTDEINRYGGNLYLQHRGNSNGSQGTSSTGNVVACTNGGNVLIGTTTDNGAKLQVNGSVVASDSVTAKSSSDYRLKCEFDYNVDYQERLLSLGKVCDYRYTEHARQRNTGGVDGNRHTGLIWQDAKRVGLTNFAMTDEDGYGSLNYLSADYLNTITGAVQMTIIGVRNLLNRTEKIEDKVERLEKENEALRREINDMRGGNYGC